MVSPDIHGSQQKWWPVQPSLSMPVLNEDLQVTNPEQELGEPKISTSAEHRGEDVNNSGAIRPHIISEKLIPRNENTSSSYLGLASIIGAEFVGTAASVSAYNYYYLFDGYLAISIGTGVLGSFVCSLIPIQITLAIRAKLRENRNS